MALYDPEAVVWNCSLWETMDILAPKKCPPPPPRTHTFSTTPITRCQRFESRLGVFLSRLHSAIICSWEWSAIIPIVIVYTVCTAASFQPMAEFY